VGIKFGMLVYSSSSLIPVFYGKNSEKESFSTA